MENNTVDMEQEYGDNVAKALIPNTILFTTFLFVGAVGNIFVLIVYSSMRKKKQLESRYFIPILSLFDLLVCLVSGIYFVLDTYLWITFESNILCQILVFFAGNTMMTSNPFLLAIAIQRYVKICRPFGKQMTLFWRRLTVVLVIFINFLYSLPSAILFGVKVLKVVYDGVNISGPSCVTGNQRYPVLQLVYYSIFFFIVILNIILTAGFYTPIACVIYKKFHKKTSNQNHNDVDLSSKDTELTSIDGVASGEGSVLKDNATERTFKKIRNRLNTSEANFNLMFFTIITVYVLSYVPTCAMLIVVSLDDRFWIDLPVNEVGVYNWLIRSYAFNHAINPFVYAYFDIMFRYSAMAIIKRRKK